MKKSIILLFLFIIQLGFSQNSLTETEKLATTCKVWGFLKYYHPKVANGEQNWDQQHLNQIQINSFVNKMGTCCCKIEQTSKNRYEYWVE